ncbi:hypothetical protein [Candidatus Accumulibacter sp. ACC007]|uniref:hypothetical protein n=1 Tax=Candidatus Accumulibacter sp. ACC007 TaxID=2823333 RepID=UPI0025B86157|nr:hypothetical protein [Candidatus Accumulibacter sp. ACC007]
MSKKAIADLLDSMAEVVHAEIAKHALITRIDLVESLGLRHSSYPKHAATKGETTWLCALLTTKLEEEGRIEVVKDGGRTFYRAV